jgi:hypothetical protein
MEAGKGDRRTGVVSAGAPSAPHKRNLKIDLTSSTKRNASNTGNNSNKASSL